MYEQVLKVGEGKLVPYSMCMEQVLKVGELNSLYMLPVSCLHVLILLLA